MALKQKTNKQTNKNGKNERKQKQNKQTNKPAKTQQQKG
jgi:hypothetical protein